MDHFIEKLPLFRPKLDIEQASTLVYDSENPIVEALFNALYSEYTKSLSFQPLPLMVTLVRMNVNNLPDTKAEIFRYLVSGNPEILVNLKNM